MYSQALDSLDYEYQTLNDYKWVASKVEFSLRKESLSYNHHKEIASLKPEDQKILQPVGQSLPALFSLSITPTIKAFIYMSDPSKECFICRLRMLRLFEG